MASKRKKPSPFSRVKKTFSTGASKKPSKKQKTWTKGKTKAKKKRLSAKPSPPKGKLQRPRRRKLHAIKAPQPQTKKGRKRIRSKKEILKHRLFEFRNRRVKKGILRNPYGNHQLWRTMDKSPGFSMAVTLEKTLETQNLDAIAEEVVSIGKEVHAAHGRGLFFATFFMHEFGTDLVGSILITDGTGKDGIFASSVQGIPGVVWSDFQWAVIEKLKSMMKNARGTAAIIEYATVRSFTPT